MKLNRKLLMCFAATLLVATSVRADGIEGYWPNGTWVDTNSGHQGPLRGNFRQTSDGNVRAVFSGRFALIVPFRYATTLKVVGEIDDKTIFAGESRLPLFGRFTYVGTANAQQFNMQYQSRRYQGTFNLQR